MTLSNSPLASFTSAFAAFHLSSPSTPLLSIDADGPLEHADAALSRLQSSSARADFLQSSRLARIRSLPSTDALSSHSSKEYPPVPFNAHVYQQEQLLLPSEAEEQRIRFEKTQLWHARQMQLREEEWYRNNNDNMKDEGLYRGESVYGKARPCTLVWQHANVVVLRRRADQGASNASTIYGITIYNHMFFVYSILFGPREQYRHFALSYQFATLL